VTDPLALTDTQLELVLEAAATIPPTWRCRFLEGIADQLTGAEVTDDRVRAAVDRVLERMAPVTCG
jgi:hypothetical protein